MGFLFHRAFGTVAHLHIRIGFSSTVQQHGINGLHYLALLISSSWIVGAKLRSHYWRVASLCVLQFIPVGSFSVLTLGGSAGRWSDSL